MAAKKWLLFDIGGVLEVVDDDTWQGPLVARWRHRAGLSPQDWRRRLDDADLPAIDQQNGVEAQYWRLVGDAVGFDAADVARMRAEMWDAYCGELNVELLEFARTLSSHVGRAILSNSVDGAREEEERRYGFSSVFDPICYSHELGVAKPARAAYEAALTLMGATARDVLFIDDHEVALEGARALGMHTLLHRDNARTIRAIEAFLAESDRR